MIIPRELVYEDRKDLKEFGVDDVLSLNHLIYEEWLLNLPDLKPFKPGLSQRRLKVFNDAYYICTLVLMHPTNEDFASYANERCSIPSVVFPMVYFLISKVKDTNVTNSRLLKDIKTGLKSEGWEDNLNSLIKITTNYSGSILSIEFAQRKLTPQLLSNIKWYKTTGGYEKDDILKIVRYISKSEEDWIMLLDAIKKAAGDYEWEYNQDLNYMDDEGQWHQSSPKDMSPIYNYCDELMKQYAEMSIKIESAPLLNCIEPAYLHDNSSLIKKNEEPINEVKINISDSRYDEKNETLYLNDIVNNKKKKAKKGRPKAKPFEDYLKPDAPEGLMKVLEDMLRGKNGKDAASIIVAITGVWIDEPPISSICERFPSITITSFEPAKNRHYGTNRFYGKSKPFDQEVLEGIRNNIRKMLEKNGEKV